VENVEKLSGIHTADEAVLYSPVNSGVGVEVNLESERRQKSLSTTLTKTLKALKTLIRKCKECKKCDNEHTKEKENVEVDMLSDFLAILFLFLAWGG